MFVFTFLSSYVSAPLCSHERTLLTRQHTHTFQTHNKFPWSTRTLNTLTLLNTRTIIAHGLNRTMVTNTEPAPEQVLAALSSTPETPIPSRPPLCDSKTLLASDTPSTPSITAEATAKLAPTTTELEQASVSSTPATCSSSTRDHQKNYEGDNEKEDSVSDENTNSENNDADGADVIVPVELTVVPDNTLEAIPDEIWCLFLSFVPPAKLITLSRVCRRWKLMIERDLVASYWKQLTIQAEILDHSLSMDLDVDSEHAEMPIGFVKTFPELVLGHTLVICELCLMRSKRGCGSAIPLPVDRQDTLGRVWMCRPCRRAYYDRYPGPERMYKAEDSVSLYGLPGYPPKVRRSTGPPAPRRRHYYPRERWGGGGRYYDDFDSNYGFDSSDDEYCWDSDEFGGGRGCYYATEADLEEDERWSREADAREAAAEEAARVLMGVVKGDAEDDGQGVQNSGNKSSDATIGDKPASGEQPETQEATPTEGRMIGQSCDVRGTSTDGGYDADGKPEIKPATSCVEVEPEDEQGMANEEEGDEDKMEEEDEIDEEDEEMYYDESDQSGDDDDEEEDEEEPETKKPQMPANQSIVREAHRHHGGDIGIQAHNNSNVQLRARLQPLRNRLMEIRLGLLGLRLRTDSKLCQDYLDGLWDDPFKIADVMKQMQWYFSATEYSSYIEDSDSSTAKSAAMEQWIEEMIEDHGENAKKAYRGLEKDEDLEDAVVDVMNPEQPPKSLWGVLDKWIDHRLKGDQSYSPGYEIFTVLVATDDLQD